MTDKKIRVQFDMTEISALIYHLDMEIDSITEVYKDISRYEEEKDEAHKLLVTMDLAKKMKVKLLRTLEKHLTE